MVEESHAGSDVYSSGMQYENPVSCIVAGRGFRTVWGVGEDHISRPLVSVLSVISFGFIVTAGKDLAG